MPEEKVDNTPVVAEAPRLIVSPLNGQVVEAFSVDQLVYSETLGDWRTHDGVDIAAAQGTSVLAASSGTVVSVTDDPLMTRAEFAVVLCRLFGWETVTPTSGSFTDNQNPTAWYYSAVETACRPAPPCRTGSRERCRWSLFSARWRPGRTGRACWY